ncbi:MAG: hypothetical protein WBC71_14590 [Salaquimonas sp.]
MSAQVSRFLNGNMARLLFALLALLLAIFFWFQYQQVGNIKSSQSEILDASEVAAMGNNPAIAKCAETRFAQIDQLVSDGYLDPSLIESEREKVVSRCIVTGQ